MRALPAFALAAVALAALPAEARMSMSSTFTLNCSGCHGEDGTGVPERGIPNLADAGYYVVLPEGRAYLVNVPGLSQSRLDDATAADLLNYILGRFAAANLPKDFPPYSEAEVARFRADKASDAVARRARILATLEAKGLLPAAYGKDTGK